MTQEEFFYQCIDVIEHWLNGNRKLSDLREVTDKLYNEVTKPHWISVEDELPEVGVAVLTITPRGTQRVGFYEDGWWLANYIDLVRMGSITHWMPKPEAPTVAKNATVKEKGGEK